MKYLTIKKIWALGLLFFLGSITSSYAQNGKCISGDCYNGTGTYQWPTNDKFTGQFVDGKITGQGVYTWANGTRYEGEWLNNFQHGHGLLTLPDGRTQRGRWAYGEFKSQEPPSAVASSTPKPKPKPKPTPTTSTRPTTSSSSSTTTTSSTPKRKGCQVGDCINGFGKLVLSNGESYEGNFVNGKFQGNGTYIWPDRRKYIGEWKNGKRDGKGAYYLPNLQKKVGLWANGVFVREVKGQETTVTTIVRNKDMNPPQITISSPTSISRGMAVTVKEKEITVQGVVTDETGIKSVRVSGSAARLTNPGSKTSQFTARLTLHEGQNRFNVEASDVKDNVQKMDFTLVYNSAPMNNHTVASRGSENRTALVIGNSNYEFAKLPNAVNDADSLARELRLVGFDVIHKTDLNRQQMEETINDFGAKLKERGGVGMVYYAGHGLQIGGENYLVPVRSDISKEKDIKYKSVHMGYLLDELETAGNGMNIVVLDACRDNPYSTKYRSMKNGLAGIAIAPVGTYIAYATSPGGVASDGKGVNGLYTQELLKALRVPGLKIEDVFKIVRTNVRRSSNGQQIPWENSSLEGNFYFRR